MKPLKALALLLALSLLCSCTPIVIPSDQPTETTAEDIFCPTTAPTESSEPESVPPTTEDVTGYYSYHVDGDIPRGSNNVRYLIYGGEEIDIKITLGHESAAGKYGDGLIIFLDGIPQPYKIDPDGEYAFLHKFYHRNSSVDAHFIFTPVTGQQGDKLECYIIPVFEVDLARSEGVRGSGTDVGSSACSLEIHYEATPQKMNYPSPCVKLSELSVSEKECPSIDIIGWSDEDLITRIGYSFTVDGGKGVEMFGVSNERPLALDLSVWGTPYIDHSVVFFVDYMPVTDAEGKPIFFTVNPGMKTTVHAMMDMSDFSTERVVFAVLVPRNRFSCGVKIQQAIHATLSMFLLERELKKK